MQGHLRLLLGQGWRKIGTEPNLALSDMTTGVNFVDVNVLKHLITQSFLVIYIFFCHVL